MNTSAISRPLVLIILTCILLVLMSSAVGASNGGSYFGTLRGYTTTYNSNIDKVPGFIRFLVREQRVALTIQSAGGSDEVLGVATDTESRVTDFTPNPPPNPTMRVTVTPGTVERLIDENSGKVVLAAVGSDIRFQGVGILNGARALFIRLGANLARLFV